MRGSFDIRRAWLTLTLAAWLAACSGTRPGFLPSPEVHQRPFPPTTVTGTVREGAPPAATPPSSSAAAALSADATGASAPAPPEASSDNARDRQFEILNDAVAALRQEVSRSYKRAEELAVEGGRLRALVASLRRDLRKSGNANKSLSNQLLALEKKLHEISSPPAENTPATETRGAASPEEKTAPAPPPPRPPEAPPPQAPARNPGGGASDKGSGAKPEDETD